jgi:uncharacterized membrane protein YfcA
MTAWLVAFTALFLADICWVLCVREVRDDVALSASLWAVALFVATSVGIIGFTTDRWLLMPASAGTFAGTYTGVWWSTDGQATFKEKIMPPLFNIWATLAIAMMIWFPWLDTPSAPSTPSEE